MTYATDTAADFSELGVSAAEVLVPLATVGIIASVWVSIDTAAKADVFLAIAQIGDDATLAPGIGCVNLKLK